MSLNLTLENILKRIAKAQAWEIKDPLFNQIIADCNTYPDINDAIKDLQNDYAGQPVIIKAGNKDKNGNLSNNAKTFQIVIPKNTDNNSIIQITPTGNTEQIIYTGIGGIKQELNPQNLSQALGELERRLTEKFDVELKKTALELEYTYKLEELERREREIARKEREIERMKRKYEEKTARIVPKIKDLGTALLEGIIKDDKDEKSEKKELKGTDFDFQFEGEEENNLDLEENEETEEELTKEDIKELLKEFSKEELNEILKDFINEEKAERQNEEVKP